MRSAARATLSLLLVAACAAPKSVPSPPPTAGAGTAQPGIVGTTWFWGQTVDPEGRWAPADPARYTLALSGDGTVAVLAECNRGNGRYTLKGSQLELGPLATTRMACPPGSLDDRYLKQLAGIRNVALVAGLLRAELPAGSGTMWFASEPDAQYASYACAEGKRAWVVYTPGRARVLADPDLLDLAEVASGTVVVYRGAPAGADTRVPESTWFTKGTEAFLERGGARVLADCHVELRAGAVASATSRGDPVARSLAGPRTAAGAP